MHSTHSIHTADHQQSHDAHAHDHTPSRAIEEQALRVAAEARAERVEQQCLVQTQQIEALQAQLAGATAAQSDLSEEATRLKNELFNVEVELADYRDKAALTQSVTNTLKSECVELRKELQNMQTEQGDRLDSQYREQSALIRQLEAQLSEYSEKLQNAEAVSSVQQQLLTQRDIQIQQGRDAQFTQQHLYNSLQLQLQEQEREKENVLTNANTAAVSQPTLQGMY